MERLQKHNDLRTDELFEMVAIFFRLIRDRTGRELQNPRNFDSNIVQYKKCDLIDDFDVQILFGYEHNSRNINIITVAFYALEENRFRLDTYQNSTASPQHANVEQKKILNQIMYRNDVLTRWTNYSRQTYCKDGAVDCDCGFVLSLAKAILLIQGQKPERFLFKMSKKDEHGTMFIRQKLREMYDEGVLLPFEEEK